MNVILTQGAMFLSLLQAAMITAWSVRVPDSAGDASPPTPRCRVSVCWTVAETTSWTPPRKSANVRDKTLIRMRLLTLISDS